MSIVVDHRKNEIVWRMDAHFARTLADFIRLAVALDDRAHEDADRLDAAADALDPREAPNAE